MTIGDEEVVENPELQHVPMLSKNICGNRIGIKNIYKWLRILSITGTNFSSKIRELVSGFELPPMLI